jgi:SAM-dependent methyltransferase
MTTYVFDQRWQREHDRLRSLEKLFNGVTQRRLLERGLDEGWRCLEVGCGAGGIALWMADRAGSEGHVVATDLDTRFVDPSGRSNLEVQEHNILIDEVEEGSFDLVHARAVVEHLPERERVLAKLISALRPGGWLVLEDVHFGGPMAAAASRYFYPRQQGDVVERMYRAIDLVFAAAGADASFGPALPGSMKDAGLLDVGGDVHAPIVQGGSERWVTGTVEQLAERLVATGVVTAEEIDTFLAVAAAERSHYLPPPLVGAWGRRPGAPA